MSKINLEKDFELEKEDVNTSESILTIVDVGWCQYVLSKLDVTEFFNGSPTVDGLRRVLQLLMGDIVSSISEVVQTPCKDNDFRATVVHTITVAGGYGTKIYSGAADVSSNNVDAKFAKYPVALAETRAEGRALRRALNLKVVVAEELENQQEIHQIASTGGAISEGLTTDQVKFVEIIAQRIDVDVEKLLKKIITNYNSIVKLSYDDGVLLIKELSQLQTNGVDVDTKGYKSDWRTK